MIWTEETVKYLQKLMYQLNVASLDELVNNEEYVEHHNGLFRIDFLAADDVDKQLEDKFTRDTLNEFLAKLRPREIKVLTLRFGLDGNTSKSLQEISEIFGLTRERIRQVEAKALSRLKIMMAKAGINTRNDI